MADPTTRQSTPAQSGRIAQETPTNAVVLQAYSDETFPGIAFTNQIAINLTGNTLMYYSVDGGWQGIVAAADVQSFYGPVEPTTTNLSPGDRWFDTSTGMWNIWTGTAWLTSGAAYSADAPTDPVVGQAWFNTTNAEVRYWDGTDWVLAGSPTAPSVFVGGLPAAATAGSVWTDASGVQRFCNTTYTSGASMSYWTQLTLPFDPLAELIPLSGVRIDTGEATPPPNPTPDTTVTPVAGMVWKDTEVGSTEEGSFYVYSGAAWTKITDPTTLATAAAMTPAPSTPPAASPAVIVYPNSVGFTLVCQDVAQTSEIEYHASETSGFTPGPSTLLRTTRATVQTFTALPSGLPFLAEVEYYFVVVAKNDLGDAPPTAEAVATLKLIGTGQVDVISADKIVAGEIDAAVGLLGQLKVGNITLDPDQGLKIPLSSNGVIQFPADGSAATIEAAVVALSLTVKNELRLLGTNNSIEGSLDLQSNIGNPDVQPTAISYWDPADALHFQTPAGTSGPWYDIHEFDANYWLITQLYAVPGGAASYLFTEYWKVHKTTGVTTNVVVTGMPANVYISGGGVLLGGFLYFYGWDPSLNSVIIKVNATTAAYVQRWVVTVAAGREINAVASDGTNIFTAHRAADGTAVVCRTTTTGGTQSILARSGFSMNPGSLTVGTMDLGATRYVMLNSSTGIAEVLGAGAPGTRHTANSFTAVGGAYMRGLAWSALDSKFYAITDVGVDDPLLWAADTNATAVSRSIKYTWAQGSGPAIESMASPSRTYSQVTRTPFKVSTAPIPGAMGGSDPDRVKIYIQAHGQAALAASATSGVYKDSTINTVAADSPGTNGFAALASPGFLQSEASDSYGKLLKLSGDGTARLHDLAVSHAEFGTPQRQTAADTAVPNGGSGTLMRWTGNIVTDPMGLISNPNSAINLDGRIVFLDDGIYQINMSYVFGSGTTGQRQLALLLNAGAVIMGIDNSAGAPTGGTALAVNMTRRFAANDYFTTQVYQTSGGALSVVSAADGYNHVHITRIAK